MNNPHNIKTAEAKHHTWAAGYMAASKEDNPYSDQTDPDLNSVWLQGYVANKARGGVKKSKAPLVIPEDLDATEDDLGPVDLTHEKPDKLLGINLPLDKLPTDVLELELKKRKILELQSLLKQREEIEKKIQVLSVLMGE